MNNCDINLYAHIEVKNTFLNLLKFNIKFQNILSLHDCEKNKIKTFVSVMRFINTFSLKF